MLRHPARRYIHYLFSRRSLGVADIIGHIADLGFPVPQSAPELKAFVLLVTKERQHMKFPPDFDPMAVDMNDGTRAFLTHWRIGDMWANHPDAAMAAELLHVVQVRRMIETLLLGPLTMNAIAKHVRTRFGISPELLHVGVIRAYAHYFWDYSSMTTPEWREMIWTWCPGYNDDYLIALLAPRTTAGVHLAVAAADRGGNSVESVHQFMTVRDYSFRMFMQHAMNRPSLSNTQAAMMSLNMLVTAEEEVAKHRGGSAELIEELRNITADHDTTAVATVTEIPVERALPSVGTYEQDSKDDETENTDGIPDAQPV